MTFHSIQPSIYSLRCVQYTRPYQVSLCLNMSTPQTAMATVAATTSSISQFTAITGIKTIEHDPIFAHRQFDLNLFWQPIFLATQQTTPSCVRLCMCLCVASSVFKECFLCVVLMFAVFASTCYTTLSNVASASICKHNTPTETEDEEKECNSADSM